MGSRAWTFVELQVGEVLRGQLGSGGSGAALATGGEAAALAALDGEALEPETCDPGPVEWAWTDPLASPTSDDGAEPEGPMLVSGGCSVDDSWTAPDSKDGAAGPQIASMSSGTFTFRLPYGHYPDGTMGTIVDTPGFSAGDEVIVFLTYEEDGDHLFIPLSWMGWSVYRVFRSNNGRTAVVNGFGQTLHYRSNGLPGAGAGDPDLRYLFFQDPPISGSAAGAALNAIASAATWTGSGRAIGPWRGHLRAVVGGDESSTCDTRLAGLVNATTLSLKGRCNADMVGAADVLVQGTHGSSGWTGTVTFTPLALPNEPRSVSWSSAMDSPDRLLGAANGTHAESGHTFTYDIDLRAGFVGPRPLLTFSAFRNYLLDLASEHAASAGVGESIELNTASCNFVVPVGVHP